MVRPFFLSEVVMKTNTHAQQLAAVIQFVANNYTGISDVRVRRLAMGGVEILFTHEGKSFRAYKTFHRSTVAIETVPSTSTEVPV